MLHIWKKEKSVPLTTTDVDVTAGVCWRNVWKKQSSESNGWSDPMGRINHGVMDVRRVMRLTYGPREWRITWVVALSAAHPKWFRTWEAFRINYGFVWRTRGPLIGTSKLRWWMFAQIWVYAQRIKKALDGFYKCKPYKCRTDLSSMRQAEANRQAGLKVTGCGEA